MTTPTEVLFQTGDLVELHSVKEDEDFRPVLFVEYQFPETKKVNKVVPLNVVQVPNGTKALLLEPYTTGRGQGLIKVLVNEMTYLTMSAQLKKIEYVCTPPPTFE